MSEPVIVTGATGLLGRAAVLDLAADHEVVAVTRGGDVGVAGVREVSMDLADADAWRRLLDESGAGLVLHTAAMASLEDCEADLEVAQHVNAEIPGVIAGVCKERGVRLVHVSTDAVFAGDAGPYTEDDQPDPQHAYGRSKLAGERAVLEAYDGALVARTNLFGWSRSGQRSLAEFFANAAEEGRAVTGYTDVHFASLYTRDLVATLVEAARAGIHGVCHVVSRDSLSKWEFGRLVVEGLGHDPDLVRPGTLPEPDPGQRAAPRRTHRLTLDATRLAAELDHPLPSLAEGVRRLCDDASSGYRDRLRHP